jgi:hypothetical protein
MFKAARLRTAPVAVELTAPGESWGKPWPADQPVLALIAEDLCPVRQHAEKHLQQVSQGCPNLA